MWVRLFIIIVKSLWSYIYYANKEIFIETRSNSFVVVRQQTPVLYIVLLKTDVQRICESCRSIFMLATS